MFWFIINSEINILVVHMYVNLNYMYIYISTFLVRNPFPRSDQTPHRNHGGSTAVLLPKVWGHQESDGADMIIILY